MASIPTAYWFADTKCPWTLRRKGLRGVHSGMAMVDVGHRGRSRARTDPARLVATQEQSHSTAQQLDAVEPHLMQPNLTSRFWVERIGVDLALAYTHHMVAHARGHRNPRPAGNNLGARIKATFASIPSTSTTASKESTWRPKALRRTTTSKQPNVCWPFAGFSTVPK